MESNHTVYFNMCHHYRKLFSAKPCVDTSNPKVLKSKCSSVRNFSRNVSPFRQNTCISTMDMIKPSQNQVQKREATPIRCKYYERHIKNTKQVNVKEKSFVKPRQPFSPIILKSDVPSKIRNLSVYHPPRRKPVQVIVSQNGNIRGNDIQHCPSSQNENKNSKRSSFSANENNSYSEEYSEDSAFNEGECNLSSDSRGSTPQNLIVKNQIKSVPQTDNNVLNNVTANQSKSDDLMYLQFLKDVTNDILKKDIFTNKALKSVFQSHVRFNKYDLDPDRMLKEIHKLQERLGVPKDDDADEEEYGLGGDTIDRSFESLSISSHHTEPVEIEEKDENQTNEYSEHFEDSEQSEHDAHYDATSEEDNDIESVNDEVASADEILAQNSNSDTESVSEVS